MSKTFTDNWGDSLRVDTLHGSATVFLNDSNVRREDGDMRVDFAFSISDARALAKALKKAAKRAERHS